MSDIVLRYGFLRSHDYYFLFAISKVDQLRARISITRKRTTWSKKVPLLHIEMIVNYVTGFIHRLLVVTNYYESANCVLYRSEQSAKFALTLMCVSNFLGTTIWMRCSATSA